MRAEGRHFDPVIDEITQKIMNMMLDGTWKVGKSHRQIAEEYPERTPDQIRQYAAAASRFIRLCRGSEDEVRERILLGIDRGIELAENAEKIHFDQDAGEFRTINQPDLKALESFLKFMAEVHGILIRDPKRPQSESVDVPIEELSRVLGALGYDVTKRKDDTNGSSDASGTSAEESED